MDNMNENNKKVSPVLILLVSILVLAVCGFCVWKFVLDKSNTNNSNGNNTNTTPSPKPEETNALEKYNGVYESEFGTIKLYASNNKTLMFTFVGVEDNIVSGWFERDGNEIKSEIMDEIITVKLESNNIIIESNTDEVKSGTYTKIAEYTLDEYYAETYGDPKFLETNYNGKYTNGSEYIYVYQSEDDEVIISGLLTDNLINMDLEIINEGYAKTDLFDETYEITLEDETLTLTVTENGETTYENTFKREKTLTKKDIIENINR